MDAQAPTPLRVVLIEDSAVLRDLLTAMLGGIEQVEIVGTADSEVDGLLVLKRERPHLVIVDLELKNGTGLGLPISRHIAEHFGGRLWLEPTAQPGACFCFWLPLPKAPIGDKTP